MPRCLGCTRKKIKRTWQGNFCNHLVLASSNETLFSFLLTMITHYNYKPLHRHVQHVSGIVKESLHRLKQATGYNITMPTVQNLHPFIVCPETPDGLSDEQVQALPCECRNAYFGTLFDKSIGDVEISPSWRKRVLINVCRYENVCVLLKICAQTNCRFSQTNKNVSPGEHQ